MTRMYQMYKRQCDEADTGDGQDRVRIVILQNLCFWVLEIWRSCFLDVIERLRVSELVCVCAAVGELACWLAIFVGGAVRV